ncbi:unnamed protein product [Ostreobium quekettii]|uniref:non-specific serine/threonine protein kinase n=1 Tax=Ostreobium quekettii TaxID=121088 RepID=A0A8S1J5D3_9CHLO|nr:unnamed protein product [Ostreobium quekettii]
MVLLAHDERLPPGSPPVAIKCIARWWLCGDRQRKCAEREIKNHRKLYHKHVVAFREAFLTQTHLCIVLDYATRGNMHRLLRDCYGGRVEEDVARWYFQMLITAVDYCHKRGVSNRDIKLDNLLVEQTDEQCLPILLICDFGLSKHNESITPPSTNVGTPIYQAPEVIFSCGQCDYDPEMVDIYSCGVVLYRMLFGIDKAPMGDLHMEPNQSYQEYVHKLQALIVSKGDDAVLLPRPGCGQLSSECMDLLRRMLAVDPGNRITMDEIWAHPWFTVDLPRGTRKYNSAMCSSAVLEKHFSKVQSEEELQEIVAASGQRNLTNGLVHRVGSIRRLF